MGYEEANSKVFSACCGLSRLLALSMVKALHFVLAVTLRIGSSNGTKLKVEDNFGTLPSI